jgi:hypothetical protein
MRNSNVGIAFLTFLYFVVLIQYIPADVTCRNTHQFLQTQKPVTADKCRLMSAVTASSGSIRSVH